LLPFADQARSQWDRGLIFVWLELLARGAAGDDVSTYHLEAAIAAHHALAPSASETPWEAVAGHYDALFARAELARYPFLDAALGEFSLRLGHVCEAKRHFELACGLARNDAERAFLRARVDAIVGR
jgi:RNA polymerase sigma-70 factor (ECF subfamily)